MGVYGAAGQQGKSSAVAFRTLFGGAPDQALNAFETEAVTVRPDTSRVNVSADGEVSFMDFPAVLQDSPSRSAGVCRGRRRGRRIKKSAG